MKKDYLFTLLLLILCLLLDNQLGIFLSTLFPAHYTVSSYLLFLVFGLLKKRWEKRNWLIVIGILGFIYDAYCLSVVGFAVFYWPLIFALLATWFDLESLRGGWLLLLQLLSIFVFEMLLYSVALLFHQSQQSFVYFVAHEVGPTLFSNFLIGMLLYPIMKVVFKKNRHSIVTNV